MSERSGNLFGDSDRPEDTRLRRTVSFAIASIKSSIERGFPPRALDENPELSAAWKSAVLKVESIRVDFTTYMVRPRNSQSLHTILSKAHEGLISLLEDDEFINTVENLRYRPNGAVERDRSDLDPRFFERGDVIPDVIADLVDLTRAYNVQSIKNNSSIAYLRSIVPAQKIAPVQFGLDNGKLIIVDQPTSTLPEDRDNVSSSRDALITYGKQILDALEQSNCDRRLVESVRELQCGLETDQNIIQLGLSKITCEAVCDAFRDELPDALYGKLQGHTRGVTMYLAQFPDWQRFSEKAGSVDLDDDDIRRISATARALVTNLEAHPEIADPKVPRTIAMLREAISDPSRTTKRAAFAVLRTIENLVAKAVEYGAELIDSTITKSISDLSTAAAKAVVITVLTLALAGASGLGPIAGKVSEAAWLKNVAEVVKAQIASAVR